ncbi:MAG: porin family protein [Porphyromonadaceae bacterium]|nr:porin family protein [Porphyromonadaceae bacterium]
MRKYIYALALSLALCATSGAQQTSFRQSWWVGAKGGVQFSRFLFVPSVRQHTHFGQRAGVALRFEVERGASAQIEVNYMRTGWKVRFEEADKAYQRHLTYVEVPILAQLYLGSGAARLFVNAGPILGYNLGEETEKTDAVGPTTYQREVVNKLFWGLGGGPGLSVALGSRNRLELEGRFTYGFGDIWPNQRKDDYGQSAEMIFGFTCNYFFRLK